MPRQPQKSVRYYSLPASGRYKYDEFSIRVTTVGSGRNAVTTVEKKLKKDIYLEKNAIDLANELLELSKGVLDPTVETERYNQYGDEGTYVYFTGWVTPSEEEQVRIDAYLDGVKAEQEAREAKRLADEEALVAELKTRRPELFV